MLTTLKHRIKTPSKVTGVSIELVSKDSFRISYTTISKKKQKLEIQAKGAAVVDLESFFDRIDTKIPVVISISGVGVIHKKLQFDTLNLLEALPYILPNSNPEDFVCQKCTSNSDSAFYSIIRTDVLNNVLNIFKEKGCEVIDVTLGPFSIAALLPIIKNDSGDLHIDKYTVEFNKSSLLSISPNGQSPNSELLLDGETIDGDIVNAYCTGVQTVAGLQNSVSIDSEDLTKVQEEFYYKKIFKVGGWSVLLFVLIALLLNFFADSYLTKENTQLQELYSTDSLLLSQSDIFEKEVTEKERFLKKAGWLSTSKGSFYLDQLAANVPDDVILSKMSYQPIDRNLSREQRKTVYQMNKIFIEGSTNNGTTLNSWIKIMNTEPWIAKIDVIGFEYDSKTKLTHFIMEVDL